jgi:hypothetical protein
MRLLESARAAPSAAAHIRETRPVRGTPGERYFRSSRRIDTGAVADVLERTDAIGWQTRILMADRPPDLNVALREVSR